MWKLNQQKKWPFHQWFYYFCGSFLVIIYIERKYNDRSWKDYPNKHRGADEICLHWLLHERNRWQGFARCKGWFETLPYTTWIFSFSFDHLLKFSESQVQIWLMFWFICGLHSVPIVQQGSIDAVREKRQIRDSLNLYKTRYYSLYRNSV